MEERIEGKSETSLLLFGAYDIYMEYHLNEKIFLFSMKIRNSLVIVWKQFNWSLKSQIFTIIVLLFWESPQVLAHGFSLESEWQQVSSSLQDSSQYSDRSQQCCSLDGFHSFSYF